MHTGHPLVYMKGFQILTKGFNHCMFNRKIYKTTGIAHKKIDQHQMLKSTQ